MPVVAPQRHSGRVSRRREPPLKVGDELTWFYPSTEFISPRPFKCQCSAGDGIYISIERGSYFLTEAQRSRHLANKHISALLAEMEGWSV